MLYNSLVEVFSSFNTLNFEVICIDDGSSDDTLKHLIQLTKKDIRFYVLEFSRNFGKEAALTAGLFFARGNAVIPIDADLQDPPDLIPKMIEECQKGAKVVVARRIDRKADSFFKRKTAEMFYSFHNYLCSLKTPKNSGDFHLIDRVVIDALNKLPEQNHFIEGTFYMGRI